MLGGESIRPISEWLERASPESQVSIGLPSDENEDSHLLLYPLGLTPEASLRSSKFPAKKVKVDWLLLGRGIDLEKDISLLENLCFSAMEQSAFSLNTEGNVSALWSQIGISPRPALLLSVSVVREPPVKEVKLVRSVRSEQVPFLSFFGQVTTSDGAPLPGVEVLHSEANRRAIVKNDGTFVFTGLTNSPEPESLSLRKGGIPLVFSASQSDESNHIVFKIKL